MPTTTGENRPNYRSELESAPTGSNPASPTRVCAGHRRFPSRLTAEWEPECATHGIDDHRRRTLVRLQATNGSRSEERRVGKECRARWWPQQWKKKRESRMATERTSESTLT